MPLQPLHIYLTQIPMPQKGWKSSIIHRLGEYSRMLSTSPPALPALWMIPEVSRLVIMTGTFYIHIPTVIWFTHTNELWTTSYSLYNLVGFNEKYPTCSSKALQTRRVKNIHQSTLFQAAEKKKHLLISWPKKEVGVWVKFTVRSQDRSIWVLTTASINIFGLFNDCSKKGYH